MNASYTTLCRTERANGSELINSSSPEESILIISAVFTLKLDTFFINSRFLRLEVSKTVICNLGGIALGKLVNCAKMKIMKLGKAE